MRPGFTATLAQFSVAGEGLNLRSTCPAAYTNGGCPNLDEASQNRAIRGIRQVWRIGSNTIIGESLD
jgi:hypothetical protein